jgi:hypothetical protein
MELFTSALAKIARAEKQTESLKMEIASFLAEKNYEVRQDTDHKTGRKTAVFNILKEIPIEWAIIIGEIIHDLRSALDHIITDLTIAENGKSLDNTEFPIFEIDAGYFSAKKDGTPSTISGLYKIRGVSARAKALIEAMQPFRRNPGDKSSLLVLNKLSIIDKHRTIHIVRQQAAQFRCDVLRDIHPIEMNIPVGEVKDGTKLAEWLPAMEPKEEMDMKFEFNFFIAICEQGGNYNVVEMCAALIKAVRAVVKNLKI